MSWCLEAKQKQHICSCCTEMDCFCCFQSFHSRFQRWILKVSTETQRAPWICGTMDKWRVNCGLKSDENVKFNSNLLILWTPPGVSSLYAPEQLIAYQQGVDGQRVSSFFYVSNSEDVNQNKMSGIAACLKLFAFADGFSPIEGSVGLVLQHLVEIFQGFYLSSCLEVSQKWENPFGISKTLSHKKLDLNCDYFQPILRLRFQFGFPLHIDLHASWKYFPTLNIFPPLKRLEWENISISLLLIVIWSKFCTIWKLRFLKLWLHCKCY